MRKTERKLLERSWKPERKVEKLRADNYDVPIKDATKKRQRERNQQKLASENNGKLERERKMARERSKRYRQKKKDQNAQVQAAEAAQIEVTGTPYLNRMAKKRAIGRAKKGLPDTPEEKGERNNGSYIKKSTDEESARETRINKNTRRGERSDCTKSARW